MLSLTRRFTLTERCSHATGFAFQRGCSHRSRLTHFHRGTPAERFVHGTRCSLVTRLARPYQYLFNSPARSTFSVLFNSKAHSFLSVLSDPGVRFPLLGTLPDYAARSFGPVLSEYTTRFAFPVLSRWKTHSGSAVLSAIPVRSRITELSIRTTQNYPADLQSSLSDCHTGTKTST